MLLLFLAVVLTHGLFAAPQQITWGTPTQISTIGVNATSVKVVSDSNGNVTGAWIENGSVVTSSMPSGGSWSSLTTLTTVSASYSNLGVDGSGNVEALWGGRWRCLTRLHFPLVEAGRQKPLFPGQEPLRQDSTLPTVEMRVQFG